VNISAPSNSSALFEVVTSRGTVHTHHVVHAQNAWIPHLVPGLRGNFSAALLHMSAQAGGQGIPHAGEWPPYIGNQSAPGGRAWSFFLDSGLDYAVQMPNTGILMFGGGEDMSHGPTAVANPLNDSATPNHRIASYLNGALPDYFGYDLWGAERDDFDPSTSNDVWPGRSKRVWTGVEGFSADHRPLVGSLPESVTFREAKNASNGEWTSTAYDGEGVCYAWLCGKALSTMILSAMKNENSSVPEWFPHSLLVTEGRLQGK
jgi:glycine/D-amino acid oxidase-like deaminating enzyme